MTVTDPWSEDSSIRTMRRVFRAMEKAQKGFFDLLRISPLDPRLGSWRERARVAFESAWTRAAQLGTIVGENEAATLYTHCLAKILEADGVKVPEAFRTLDQELAMLSKEGRP